MVHDQATTDAFMMEYEPQQLNAATAALAQNWQSKFQYSDIFSDDLYNYRYVVLPRGIQSYN